ncbi:MAG: hypothetical protein OSB41_11420, partial [Kiritimatiellae bacterium]|nr:hypothetical protein [Kiritimatiellia bacterium]
AIYWSTLHESRGITRYQMVATPFNLVSIIVLSLFLIHSMGITGVAIAVAVTMLVSLVFFVPWFVRKVLPNFSYIRVLTLPLVLCGFWFLCGGVMHRYVPASFWPLGLFLLTLGFCMSVAALDRKLMGDLHAVWSMRKAD